MTKKILIFLIKMHIIEITTTDNKKGYIIPAIDVSIYIDADKNTEIIEHNIMSVHTIIGQNYTIDGDNTKNQNQDVPSIKSLESHNIYNCLDFIPGDILSIIENLLIDKKVKILDYPKDQFSYR